MIDLHCHILPGLDDGPSNLDFSLAMARAAVESGTQLIVATPHIRADFDVDPTEIEPRVDLFNERLQRDRLPLRVLPGAEIGWASATDLDDTQLARLSLGSGKRVLLESPYGKKHVDLEGIIAALSERGFQAVLAHPERCPLFQRDPERLRKLVAGGTLCSITAGSMLGRFGDVVRAFTVEMLRGGLVHDVASDAHDHIHRPPGLVAGFEDVKAELPGIERHAAWYTVTSPVAILAGNPLPQAPEISEPPPSRLRRLLGRTRG
ncbi:MAG: protein-tyrosine phosphatase [Thermoleophilaceae bacterium]|nr:protein-tyrosine phosphatase [Thermoleophilaceae bacterium]